MTSRLPATGRTALLTTLVAGAALAAACGDPTRPKAELAVLADTVTLYTLNDPPGDFAPVAFTVSDGSLRAVNSAFSFDVALDLDAQGRVVLYPANLVGNPFASPNRVGIQKVPETFDALTKAPRSGYRSDSVTVLAVGQAAAVQVPLSLCIYSAVGQHVYGKIGIDSVNRSSRTIYAKLNTNPNCGFRTLTPGIPKD